MPTVTLQFDTGGVECRYLRQRRPARTLPMIGRVFAIVLVP